MNNSDLSLLLKDMIVKTKYVKIKMQYYLLQDNKKNN